MVAWKVRWAVLEEPTRTEIEAREAERLAAQAAATPGAAPVSVASAPVADTAAVLATIDWADPANPVALPISGTQFLLDTRSGPRVWSPGAATLSPLGGAQAHWRLLDNTHMPASSTTGPGAFMNGMMFAVRTGAASAEVVWADSRDLAVTRRMPLPEGFVPDMLLPLAPSMGLLCSAAQQRSLVVAFHGGELVRLSKTTAQPMALQRLQARPVFGIVEGFGALANPLLGSLQYPAPPVQFDAQRCRWQANHLPEPLARAEDHEPAAQLAGPCPTTSPLRSSPPPGPTPTAGAARWCDRCTGTSRPAPGASVPRPTCPAWSPPRCTAWCTTAWP